MAAFACKGSLQFSPSPTGAAEYLQSVHRKIMQNWSQINPRLFSHSIASNPASHLPGAWGSFHQTLKGNNLDQDKGSEFYCWKDHGSNTYTHTHKEKNHTQRNTVNWKAEDQIVFLFLAAESIYPPTYSYQQKTSVDHRQCSQGNTLLNEQPARSYPYLGIQRQMAAKINLAFISGVHKICVNAVSGFKKLSLYNL